MGSLGGVLGWGELVVLFDTSVVVDMIRSGEYRFGRISIISLIEILRGVDEDKRSSVKGLLEEVFDVVGVDNSVIDVYCRLYDELRRAGRLIPDADLIIAATAIACDEELESFDEHFTWLRDLGLKLRFGRRR